MLVGISAEYYVGSNAVVIGTHPARYRMLFRGFWDSTTSPRLPDLARGRTRAGPTCRRIGAAGSPGSARRHPRSAFVLGRFMDVLASNAAADRLHGGMPDNVVRHLFLDPTSQRIYPDGAEVAADAVAAFHGSVAGHFDDPRLTQLVGELFLKSAEFGAL